MLNSQVYNLQQTKFIIMRADQSMEKQGLDNSNSDSRKCPYLSTIKRQLLDFDFQKACCLTMAKTNIYGCLVCGRYFQGRSPSSPAYQHSIQYNHYMFINLDTTNVYCLPDNYEVKSHTLSDIKLNLTPKYNQQQVKSPQFDQIIPRYSFDGREYIPGTIGLNNLKFTDSLNCIVQIFNAIKQIRQYFLLKNTNLDTKSFVLTYNFSNLIKKIWNSQNFKGAVSPHQLMQAITEKSNKKFQIGQKNNPTILTLWLIDNLSKQLKQEKSKFKLRQLFQGTLKTQFFRRFQNDADYEEIPAKIEVKPFMILNLEFPEKGIFNKVKSQVQILSLLQTYSGQKGTKSNQGIRYAKVIVYPKYLILVFKRFIVNGYNIQKDSTQLNYKEELKVSTGQKYTLIGQICHEDSVQNGNYRVYIKRGQQWFSILDLEVNQILSQQMLLGQPCIQVYRQNK